MPAKRKKAAKKKKDPRAVEIGEGIKRAQKQLEKKLGLSPDEYLTNREIAEGIGGASEGEVSHWRNGTHKPNKTRWPAIAAYFGVPEELIFGETAQEAKRSNRLLIVERKINAIIEVQDIEVAVNRAFDKIEKKRRAENRRNSLAAQRKLDEQKKAVKTKRAATRRRRKTRAPDLEKKAGQAESALDQAAGDGIPQPRSKRRRGEASEPESETG